MTRSLTWCSWQCLLHSVFQRWHNVPNRSDRNTVFTDWAEQWHLINILQCTSTLKHASCSTACNQQQPIKTEVYNKVYLSSKFTDWFYSFTFCVSKMLWFIFSSWDTRKRFPQPTDQGIHIKSNRPISYHCWDDKAFNWI